MVKGVSAATADFLSGYRDGWRIAVEGSIAVRGNIYISNRRIKKFPITISSVDGKISICCPCLLSVEGIPTQYKELEFCDCFFPNEYYTKAIQVKIPLEDVVLGYISAKELKTQIEKAFLKEDSLEILKEFFPKAYQEFRGRAVGKMFGF